MANAASPTSQPAIPAKSLEPTTTGEALENLAVAVDGFQENGLRNATAFGSEPWA